MSTTQYQESENVRKAREELEALDKSKPKFNYNINGDALYHQYKDMYERQGKAAMEDTIGRASAMTGGFGNSYAQVAGQQAYQGQLDALNDRIPELYQLALSKHDQDLADWKDERDYAASRYDAEKANDVTEFVSKLPGDVEAAFDIFEKTGLMTPEEIDALYEKYKGVGTDGDFQTTEGTTKTWNGFTAVDDGGKNHKVPDWMAKMFGGDPEKDIDRNAKIKAPDGKEYTLAEYFRYLKSKDGGNLSAEEAREKVIEIQTNLGL